MSFKGAVVAGALGFATMFGSAIQAQDVDGALTRLFGQERAAMETMTRSVVQQLARSPKAANVMYDTDWLSERPAASGGEAWTCLTEAIYFEARGETLRGQFAVAEVIINRVASAAFPDSVCGVVHQGTGRKFACQFTFTCDGRAEDVHEPAAWERSGKIARLMLDGAPRLLTNGATHYHTKAVAPRWSEVFPRTTTIGVHHFYRMPNAETES